MQLVLLALPALLVALVAASRAPEALLTRARSQLPRSEIMPSMQAPPPKWDAGLNALTTTPQAVQEPIALATTPAPAPRVLGVPDPGHFAEFLPYTADYQPEMMMKERCRGMLNRVLERSHHDPRLTLEMLPPCLWGEDQCKALHLDLFARLPKAPANSANSVSQVAATFAMGNDAVYGWCDTMWNMARANRINKLKAAARPVDALTR